MVSNRRPSNNGTASSSSSDDVVVDDDDDGGDGYISGRRICFGDRVVPAPSWLIPVLPLRWAGDAAASGSTRSRWREQCSMDGDGGDGPRTGRLGANFAALLVVVVNPRAHDAMRSPPTA